MPLKPTSLGFGADDLAKLDRLRGGASRSEYVRDLIAKEDRTMTKRVQMIAKADEIGLGLIAKCLDLPDGDYQRARHMANDAISARAEFMAGLHKTDKGKAMTDSSDGVMKALGQLAQSTSEAKFRAFKMYAEAVANAQG